MKKSIIVIIVLVLVALGAFVYITRPVAAPTQDIQSVSDTVTPTSSTSVYRISQSDSKAEFDINETLSGKPKLVVGTTTQVAGDIVLAGNAINFGTLKVDARTFVTDSSQRNGAINRLILKTGTSGNEYVTFAPKSSDFAGPIVMGKEVSFNVNGDLTISGVVKPATFKITATITADKITGTASTTVKRSDYNLVIPNIPFVANVDESFPVTITVVANKVAQ